jgi:putative ATPase
MSDNLDLFSSEGPATPRTRVPLAERCRPQSLSEIIGHEKFLGPASALQRQIKSGVMSSVILWGPPGVGKTTLARILAHEMNFPFATLSAIDTGKQDLRAVIERARRSTAAGFLLFIDEIHRYNKAQQDGLLHAIEDGTVTLVGATTENPSFEIITPLLSRCQVLKLEPLTAADLEKIVERALETDEFLSGYQITLSGITDLLALGAGDARRTLNLLESSFRLAEPEGNKVDISPEIIKEAARTAFIPYEKKGDQHYDTISAFIKSVRGSDPDAAVYYLARMLNAGEDPVFIARRLIILASEDIGNAEPYALMLATSALDAVHAIGMPEARIVLAQVTTFLASCPKSNAAYLAINQAMRDAEETATEPVPMHIRNAPTRLMKELGYANGYRYPHDFDGHFVNQQYLPDQLAEKKYYKPTKEGRELKLFERLKQIWPNRWKK